MRVILDLLLEFTNTRIFGLFHNCMWQSRHPRVGVHLFELCGRTGWLSTHNVRLCLCLCLSLNVQQTKMYSCSQGETCIDFLSTRRGRLFCQYGSARFGWLGWLSSACRASSETNSFIQSFLKEIFGGGRGDAYTFSHMISSVSTRAASRYNRVGEGGGVL